MEQMNEEHEEGGIATLPEKTEEQRPHKNGNGVAAIYNKLKKIITDLPPNTRVFVGTHANPDPDAIGSMMGIQWWLDRAFGIESDCYFAGEVSHPQNQALVNLLDPIMYPMDRYEAHNYGLRILVDTVPSHAGALINYDIVIDHHKETPDSEFKGLFINLKAGSACGTVYSLISKSGIEFESDNEADSRVATALMVGISTDTENLMSADSTDYEFTAWSKLFPYKNATALMKIVNWERPKFWVDTEAEAAKRAEITDSIGIVGLGIIPPKHRDMIADMASQMIQWENVTTSIAFAIVDGTRIEGCVRSKNASVSVPVTCKDLGTERNGGGGGKLGKGAYAYDLAGAAISDDDDDETRQKTWDLFNTKESKRILRIIKNGN